MCGLINKPNSCFKHVGVSKKNVGGMRMNGNENKPKIGRSVDEFFELHQIDGMPDAQNL